MREQMKVRPHLESLQSLTLLSGAAATALSPHHHAEVSITKTAPGATLTLSGTEHGMFLEHRSSSAKYYTMVVGGTLTPIGQTTASGYLHVLSGLASGPPNGTLHLSTNQGTLTLQIPQSAALPVGLPTATSPNEIVNTYLITKGTGAYQGDTGSGVFEFKFNKAISFGTRFQFGRANVTFTTLLPAPAPTSTS